MHDIIMNIGLQIGEGDDAVEIMPTAVLKAMRALNIRWDTATVRQSDSEPTLVVSADAADHQIAMLADAFDQMAIAVYDKYHAKGRLVGARRQEWIDKWGDFNPAYFILPNGSRLSEARSVA